MKKKKKKVVTQESSKKKEGGRCISCSRVVSPWTIEGFEAHDRVCPGGSLCWEIAASANAADPEALLDASIALKGGPSGNVIGVTRHKFRRWMPTTHRIRFESGREEDVHLSDGEVGREFRFLLDDEKEAMKLKLEIELEAVKRYAADLSKSDRNKEKALLQTRLELEDQTLCTVCLVESKTTALVPCGHRTCNACARRSSRCPVCRSRVRDTMRVY